MYFVGRARIADFVNLDAVVAGSLINEMLSRAEEIVGWICGGGDVNEQAVRYYQVGLMTAFHRLRADERLPLEAPLKHSSWSMEKLKELHELGLIHGAKLRARWFPFE